MKNILKALPIAFSVVSFSNSATAETPQLQQIADLCETTEAADPEACQLVDSFKETVAITSNLYNNFRKNGNPVLESCQSLSDSKDLDVESTRAAQCLKAMDRYYSLKR